MGSDVGGTTSSVLPAAGLAGGYDGLPCSLSSIPCTSLHWSHGGSWTGSGSTVLSFGCWSHASSTTTPWAQCHQCLESCKADADDAQPGPAGDCRGATSAWSLCASTHSTPTCSGLVFNFLLQVHCCCGSPSVQVQIEGSQFCSSCTTSSAACPCTSPRPHRRSGKEWTASNCPATSGAGSQQRCDAAVCQRHARPAVSAVCYASSAQSSLDEPDVCATV